jgi:hypothetical protein
MACARPNVLRVPWLHVRGSSVTHAVTSVVFACRGCTCAVLALRMPWRLWFAFLFACAPHTQSEGNPGVAGGVVDVEARGVLDVYEVGAAGGRGGIWGLDVAAGRDAG